MTVCEALLAFWHRYDRLWFVLWQSAHDSQEPTGVALDAVDAVLVELRQLVDQALAAVRDAQLAEAKRV